MTDLRKEAQGRDCQVRIPGICNGNPETTVLAHLSMAGISGRGIKSPDLLAAWCCSSCHDEVDRRTTLVEKTFARLYFFEGIMRTQYALLKEGKLTGE